MKRRGFLSWSAAALAGFYGIAKATKAKAALPSDPVSASSRESMPETIILPGFNKDNPLALEQALLKRHSSRVFDKDRELPLEMVSRLLWAACGVNRPGGKRTTPSALALYPVEVLAALSSGVYRYEPKAHKLVKVLDQDLRKEIPIQPGFRKAGMILLYLVNKRKFQGVDAGMRWGELEIGCMVQNVYLEAAALGLSACVFALVRYDHVKKLLALPPHKELVIAQAAGLPG